MVGFFSFYFVFTIYQKSPPYGRKKGNGYMSNELFGLLSQLISIPSLPGAEEKVVNFIQEIALTQGWNPEMIPITADGNRNNLFIAFGVPKIIFTTHLDVVDAPAHMFKPQIVDNRLFGRGACDAKGIAVAMLTACRELEKAGKSGFGLLFVLGEEEDGIGAKVAAEKLKNRGIEYVINGEPTECKLVSAHKGNVEVRISFAGKSCHSGYPELGEDANRKLIRCATAIFDANFGSDPELGQADVNIGLLSGGIGANSLSPKAELVCSVRTVTENKTILNQLKELSSGNVGFEVTYDVPLSRLYTLPHFELSTVSFCTDIPNFAALNAKCLLYGPGSITVAHTNEENISYNELTTAVSDYMRLFELLSTHHPLHHHSH